MSDDSFFREVNEDLRSERMRSFWSRYGWMVISVVVAVVVLTAGYRGYDYWQSRQASQSGDAFLEALTLARSGDAQAATAALEALQADGHGAYPVLARMREATLDANAGEAAAAIDAFTAIGEDGSAPLAIREAARLRAAYLIVDHGTYDEALAVVNTMTGDEHPMRHSAREALGLAAWKAGDLETAGDWFAAIATDEAPAAGAAERAEIMLDLIAASADGNVDAGPDEPEMDQPAAPSRTPAADNGASMPLSLETIAPDLAPALPDADGGQTGTGTAPGTAIPGLLDNPSSGDEPSQPTQPDETQAEPAGPAPAPETDPS